MLLQGSNFSGLTNKIPEFLQQIYRYLKLILTTNNSPKVKAPFLVYFSHLEGWPHCSSAKEKSQKFAACLFFQCHTISPGFFQVS